MTSAFAICDASGAFTFNGADGTNVSGAGMVPPPTRSEFAGTPMTPAIPYLPSVSALADRYDAFILDLWGVIHDGITPYPGVVESLTRLAETGKTYVMLTNAPRRATAIRESMMEMGIPEALCGNILSSGEATWRAMRGRKEAGGRRCLHIGPARDENLFDGLDLERVPSADDADFILNTGPWADGETVADYEDVLRQGAERNLHMICANPDLEVIRGGKRVICAGALALRYEELGGPVEYFGKPHPPIYVQCFDMMDAPDKSRIVAVGDSLRTDIAGAARAGIDSALLIGGIHGDEIGYGPDGAPNVDKVSELCAEADYPPTYVMSAFRWSAENAG